MSEKRDSAAAQAQDFVEVVPLQSKLIKCQEELNDNRKRLIALQDQFQSYSTVLQTAVSECTTALAPSKFRAAISSAAVKQDTSCNLIMFGIRH